MPDTKPLTDEEVHERLVCAGYVLGEAVAESTRGQTAIDAARKALALLQLGLVAAMERANPTNELSPRE